MFNREGDAEKRVLLRERRGGVQNLSKSTLNLSVLMGTMDTQLSDLGCGLRQMVFHLFAILSISVYGSPKVLSV